MDLLIHIHMRDIKNVVAGQTNPRTNPPPTAPNPPRRTHTSPIQPWTSTVQSWSNEPEDKEKKEEEPGGKEDDKPERAMTRTSRRRRVSTEG